MQTITTLVSRLVARIVRDEGGWLTGSFVGVFIAIGLVGFIRSGTFVAAAAGTEVEPIALFLSDPQAAMAAFFEQITPTTPAP